MYKVFINDKMVIFPQGDDFRVENSDSLVVEANSPKALKVAYRDFIQSEDYNSLIINSRSDIEKVFEDFVSMFWYLEAAGGVVRNSDNERLFIFRFGKWDLPKGKIEKGETKRQAAIREVTEETGLSKPEILSELPSTFHIYEYKGKTVLKRTYWYSMKYDGNATPVPQLEESITDARWFKPAEFTTVLANTYLSLHELIEAELQ